MDAAMRNALEQLADSLESIARTGMYKEHKEQIENITNKVPTDLFTMAWDIKQIARWGTASFGV
jgi:hypothetical protein